MFVMQLAWGVPSANTNRAQFFDREWGETAYTKYKLTRDPLLFPWAGSYIDGKFTILSFNFNIKNRGDGLFQAHLFKWNKYVYSKAKKINYCCWNSQLLFFFICLVICIDLLVAGKVGEFATFAKFTIFAKFAIFVKFAILAACKGGPLALLFALSRWLLEKLSKSPVRQCKALLAILTVSPTSLLRARISGHKWNRGEEAR